MVLERPQPSISVSTNTDDRARISGLHTLGAAAAFRTTNGDPSIAEVSTPRSLIIAAETMPSWSRSLLAMLGLALPLSPISVSAAAPAAIAAEAATAAIEDPSGVALDGFFAALVRTESGEPGALTRVMHVGDSSIGLDGLPHALRRRMQARFGDGGAGFVLLDRESENYRNQAATMTSSGWSICYIAYKCDAGGRYGYAGHVVRAGAGARTRIDTRTRGASGRTVSSYELWYRAEPQGGGLVMRVDGGDPLVVETVADAPIDRWHTIDVTPGAHRFELAARGDGRPRAYGVVLETDGPGVVWDTLSMIGAFARRLSWWNAEHLAAQVAHRRPDLLVFGFGGNDLRRFAAAELERPEFVAELRGVLQRLRAGRPGLACLVVGLNDHARAGKYDIHPKYMREAVAAQREAAFAEGCAFFDATLAMGGFGSIRRWRAQGLAEPDMQHLSMRGRDRLGEMIFTATLARFDAYKRRREAPAR
jgi:lysophospholipase L1-like esterase